MRYLELLTEQQLIREWSVKGKTTSQINVMIARLKRIVSDLGGNPSTKGEADNAQRLLDKIMAEMGADAPKQEQPRRERTTRDEPKKEKPKSISPSSGQFQVVFIGRQVDPDAGERGTNKVWGWGVKGDSIYQFWGRYKQTPQVKKMPNTSANRMKTEELAKKKAKKYTKVSASEHIDWLNDVLKKNPKFDG